ncbi:MAG: pilus assembly protein [Pirellulaceae bacterium]
MSGVATLEMAVCLPMLVIITFCSIEAANFIAKQSLTEAAYEAVRSLRQQAEQGQGHRRFQEIIDAREIQERILHFPPMLIPGRCRAFLVTATVQPSFARTLIVPIPFP